MARGSSASLQRNLSLCFFLEFLSFLLFFSLFSHSQVPTAETAGLELSK